MFQDLQSDDCYGLRFRSPHSPPFSGQALAGFHRRTAPLISLETCLFTSLSLPNSHSQLLVIPAMDYDRKSGTSSYYGNRRSSYDALNQDFPSPQFPEADRARHDSTSTFNNPNGPSRRSAEALSSYGTPGYNPSSFMAPARMEPVKGGYDEEAAYRDEPFDIYADFNNQGPRYSKAVFTPDDG